MNAYRWPRCGPMIPWTISQSSCSTPTPSSHDTRQLVLCDVPASEPSASFTPIPVPHDALSQVCKSCLQPVCRFTCRVLPHTQTQTQTQTPPVWGALQCLRGAGMGAVLRQRYQRFSAWGLGLGFRAYGFTYGWSGGCARGQCTQRPLSALFGFGM